MQRIRRLAAVWFADVAGYTALSSADEDAALRVVDEMQRLAGSIVERRGGRVVKYIGDAALAVFDSTDAAIQAALDLQHGFAASEVARLHDVALRVGVHLGEVVEAADGDVYGDGVNTAARVESAAAPGTVAVTAAVQQQIRNRPQFSTHPLGRRELKGLAAPIELFQVVRAGDDPAPRAGRRVPPAVAGRPAAIGILVAVFAFVSLSLFVAQTDFPDDAQLLYFPEAIVLPGVGPEDPSVTVDAGRDTAAPGPPSARTPERPSSAREGGGPAVPLSSAPAEGWRVELDTDLMTDAQMVVLALPSSRGSPARLVLSCGARRAEARIEWGRRLTDRSLRTRVDGGPEREGGSSWSVTGDGTVTVYAGDVRRLVRDLGAAATLVVGADDEHGAPLTALFQLGGLTQASRAMTDVCGWP